MNVAVPGEGDPYWFYGILGFMALLALVLVFFGWRRRWFADYDYLRSHV